jgi:hypothetical protein
MALDRINTHDSARPEHYLVSICLPGYLPGIEFGLQACLGLRCCRWETNPVIPLCLADVKVAREQPHCEAFE